MEIPEYILPIVINTYNRYCNFLFISGGSVVILLVFSGGPVDVTFAQSSDKVQAILQCFLPGQAAGEALANVLQNLGPGANPAGRLPYTWYASMDQVRTKALLYKV